MLTSDGVQAREQAPGERQEAQDKAVLEQSEMLTVESTQAQEQAPGEQQEAQEEVVPEQSEPSGEQPIRLPPWEQCPYSGCTHHNRPDYQCYKCSVAYHRDCLMKKLARTSRNSSYCETLEPITDSRHPISRLTPTYAFLCQMCTKEKHANDAFCVACQQETRPMVDLPDVAPEIADKLSSLLRCTSCWLSYHVGCLTIDYHNRFRDQPPKYLAHLSELGSPSLFLRTFNCTNCLLYPLASWKLSNIFTYRDPSPSETKPLKPQREYLVKFEETSFRDVAWVSERWLSQNYANRLSSFRRAVKDAMEQWEAGAKSHGIPPPYPAPVEAIILPEWSQVDKILSVAFDAEDDDVDDSEDNVVSLDVISGSDGTSSEDPDGGAIRGGYEDYDDDYSNSQSKKRKQHRRLSKYAVARAKKARRSSSIPTSEADVTSTTCIDPSRVDQVLVKWRLRGYEDCTWERFPTPSESDYGDFVQALRAWEKWKSLSSIGWWEERERKSKAGLIRPIPAKEDIILRARTAPHDHAADDGTPLSESSVVLVDDLDEAKEPGPSGASTVFGTGQVMKTLISDQPQCIHGGKLKEYQIEGVNWLYTNFILSQSCVLADQPGLGKTIQIITFLSVLYHDHSIYPHLIVVPASTVSNWEREFQKWAPGLRVVAYSGATEAQREYIRDYELLCDPNDLSKGLKAHVVVTSYEWVSRDPELFIEGLGKAKARDAKARPRYHTLIVDEGHRLKNDDTNLYRILKEDFEARGLVGLTILLTGTPMQNNLRELFNVLSFIDGGKFNAEELERTYGVDGSSLTSESVKRLHETIRPFFLRREKKDVLKTDIPPRIETILPIAMTTLQKQIYRAILTKNYKLLTDSTQRRKKGMMNLLVKAGGKSNILRMLLRVLYQRHHRPLIFSTSVATLKILEDMIRLEGYIYTVIDGNTPLHQRQERIDYFSAPGSPAFAFLLSTRAAGQGINLASADCVILYDPDFNPHVDEQAICRAHRIGQENGVMVWRFVCRNSVEEKVVERGRSKMALDHVVMRRMNGDTHS
ncbi:SNF2 family N-terminal domain-containing protein, partial [Gaertneriomyces semiglobifer]